jgi:spermidine synthase
VHETNLAIYSQPFLEAVRERLAPGGALVVWSAAPSPPLAENLASVFDGVEEQSHEVRLQERDEHYWLYVASRRVASTA